MSDGIEFAEEMRAPDHDIQVPLNLCKESIDNIAKTFKDAHPAWKPEGRSDIEDILDKHLGVPEAKCGIEIR